MIAASCRADAACCPRCGQASARVHGGYGRTVADGAACGRPVLIVLQVCRFRCRNPGCPAVTFAEQAAGLSERYRRRSVPLLAMLTGFGLELAGRAAARLAGTLGIAVHPATVLRLVAAMPDRELTAAPEVLGVDDFALAKGQVHGTVLVDVRTGDVVDLLPMAGISAAAGSAWSWWPRRGSGSCHAARRSLAADRRSDRPARPPRLTLTGWSPAPATQQDAGSV